MDNWRSWLERIKNDKVLKIFLFALLPLLVVVISQTIRYTRKHRYLASDSTSIAKGRISHAISFDTLKYPLSGREMSRFLQQRTERKAVNKKVITFYKLNRANTKWLGEKGPTKEYYGLVKLLREAPKQALISETYSLLDVEKDIRDIYENDGDKGQIPSVDMAISERFFLFTTHLKDGRIRPVGHNKALWKSAEKADDNLDVDALLNAKGDELSEVIEKVQPPGEQYTKLLNAYSELVNLDESFKGKFKRITIDRKIKPGDKHTAVPSIRKRLSLFQSMEYQIPYDTATGTPDSLFYDAELVVGMKKFQELHGLEPTGIIGGKSIVFLNRTFAERAAIVALNLERERWRPRTIQDRYLVVNIPEYMLHAYKNGKEELSMKVVVGAPEKPTPVFNDMLEYIIFSPTWSVPSSIIEEEILPRLQEDPDYYSERNYTFYRNRSEIDPLDEDWDLDEIDPEELTIVQQPGEDNALGLVKFVMPNHLNIYLHDTPQRRLFRKYWRAFSHGCIRLDEPEKFAEYLLEDNHKWSRQKIYEAMHAGEPETVKLKDYHQVFIDYQTAWVDKDGNLNFRDDVYGHDRVQMRQLGFRLNGIARVLPLQMVNTEFRIPNCLLSTSFKIR